MVGNLKRKGSKAGQREELVYEAIPVVVAHSSMRILEARVAFSDWRTLCVHMDLALLDVVTLGKESEMSWA